MVTRSTASATTGERLSLERPVECCRPVSGAIHVEEYERGLQIEPSVREMLQDRRILLLIIKKRRS
jgi:hypothetical protein